MTGVLFDLYRRRARALVDADQWLRLAEHSWSLRQHANGRRYAAGRVNGRPVSMHRFLLGAPDGVWVDHINGDGLDNRLANLRLCSRKENARNRKPSSLNTTGFKGVSRAPRERWKAQIGVNGDQIYLGIFDSPVAAAVAYDAAARRHHGAFASLNFPEAA